MSLYAKLVGSGRPNLLMIHGLFGQGRNWTNIATNLSDCATSLLLDAPNHGHSPWTDSFSYPAMADTIADFISERMGSAASLTVLGHSMGGKIAMTLAQRHPHLVDGLIVADIAPDRSSHGYGFRALVTALRSLDLSTLRTRAEASERLKSAIPDAAVRSFLLQNLRNRRGTFTWQCNLDLLAESLGIISSFPDEIDGTYAGPVLWLRGEKSEYVREEHFAGMMRLFPTTTLFTVPGAGHWLHSDAPDIVTGAIRNFLLAENLAITPPPQS